MVGRYDVGSRVIIPLLGRTGTVLGLHAIESSTDPLYEVLLDKHKLFGGVPTNLLYIAEDAMDPEYIPAAEITEGDIIRWHPGNLRTPLLGRVLCVHVPSPDLDCVVVAMDGDIWTVRQQDRPSKVLVEKRGTEALPKW